MTPFDEAKPVVGALVDRLLARGFLLSVHDGEEWACKQTRNKSDVLLAVFSVDESSVRVRDNGQVLGTIWVYLDNGADCIVDYSDALDQFM